ncbi:MAG: hypothetical protein M1541_19535, partial [Acidobacteria bacterium]|nr:hypothetical protein [Acidobacteriota bacterium]
SISLSGTWLMQGSVAASPTAPPSAADPYVMPYRHGKGVLEGWYRRGFNRAGWRQVQVPASVQAALMAAGELRDPFWNTNTYDELNQYGEPKDWVWQRRQTRIEQQEWWFARKFTLPAGWRGKSLRLYFDGLDYSGSVYLNGQPLGHHAGMFGGPEYDISALADFQEENELVVRLDQPPAYWTGILKGSPGFGWHYGHLISTGIWRDVRIEAAPALEISGPYVVTRSLAPAATLRIEYYVDNHGTAARTVTVTGSIQGETFPGQAERFENRFTAPSGHSRYRTEVRVGQPRLWWPRNYGAQDLYRLNLTLGSASGALDATSAVFGIRTIQMRPLPASAPETDYRWQFVINGQPIFIKGANWCWSDPMLQVNRAKYDRLLELAARAGIQMFRAWGGGIIETDEFYNQCDRRGLMVYQEFPICWGPLDFEFTDAAVIDDQVSRVVKRLRNHPALVMWGGGNENGKPTGTDEALFLVGRRCWQYDPSRSYHRTDPWGGSGHNWNVFHQGAAIDSGYQRESTVFLGEFGLPSMTGRDSSLRYLPEQALRQWPPDESSHSILAHLNQFALRDLIKTLRYADYGPVKDWDTYTEFSQMVQADALRFGAEMQRGGSNTTKSGFWFYKFTDLFPGHAWAVVDFYGTPKIAYYRARQVCRPQNAFATYSKFDWAPGEKFQATLHVANDTPRPLEAAQVSAAILGSDLGTLWHLTAGAICRRRPRWTRPESSLSSSV